MFGLVPFDRRRNQIQPAGDERSWDIDRIFENFFNDAVLPGFYNRSGFMRVDIKETDEAYWLEAELPGINRDQINLDVDQDVLTISVNQDEATEEKSEQYLRRERRCCSMTRSFNVENINVDKIAAKLENGILRLELPKREVNPKQTKKIDIA